MRTHNTKIGATSTVKSSTRHNKGKCCVDWSGIKKYEVVYRMNI